jgi:GT2 family glycosyltransferase
VKISVIILTSLRVAPTLARCITTIRKERYRDVEIILVDNATKGLERHSVDAVADRVDQVIHLPRNLGYGGGNNRGAEAASGDILFLLNDDAWILPGTLHAIADAFADDPALGIVGCKIYNQDGRTLQHAGAVLDRQAFSRHLGFGQENGDSYATPRRVDFVTGAAWAIRKHLWDRVGGLTETYLPLYYEETEFCWLGRMLGWSILFLPDARVIHHGMQTSGQLSQHYFFFYHRNRLRYLVRTGQRKELVPFLLAELRWLLSFRNWDQYPALFLAYVWNIAILPKTLLGRRKLWAKTRIPANQAPETGHPQAANQLR